MSFAAVESIVQALLYEGHLLYPYRPSALKNRERWLFGRLLPREFCLANDNAESWKLQAECLILGAQQAEVEVCLRFLQLNDASVAGPTVERDVRATVSLEQIARNPFQVSFAFQPRLEGTLTLTATDGPAGLFKLTVSVENCSPEAAGERLERALFRSLLQSLLLLRAENGSFLSLLDPPQQFRAAATGCQNRGVWPVLVGPVRGQMMLAAPIILYDYPQIASESPGDLFDGTEIDELLSLRIQTLAPAEKEEMSAAGPQASALLERTDALTEEQLLSLHGRLQRSPSPACGFRPGDRVRLRPRQSADALDLLFCGQAATIVSVERDFEERVHLAVVFDDDPGRDFGERGLPGHRFFYRPEEVERM